MGESLFGNSREGREAGTAPSCVAEGEAEMTEEVIYGNCSEGLVSSGWKAACLYAWWTRLACQTEKRTGITQGRLGASAPPTSAWITPPKLFKPHFEFQSLPEALSKNVLPELHSPFDCIYFSVCVRTGLSLRGHSGGQSSGLVRAGSLLPPCGPQASYTGLGHHDKQARLLSHLAGPDSTSFRNFYFNLFL